MNDTSTLLMVASIIAGFGATIFTFRLQREIQMTEHNMLAWIPCADRLVVSSVLLSLLVVILPLVSVSAPSEMVWRIAASGCTMSVDMLAGYVPAILAHYRLIFGDHTKAHWNPEPAERRIVLATVVLGAAAFLVVLLNLV